MDIADWRKKIDEIDAQLVELLNRRAVAATEIGKIKAERGMAIYEPKREEQIYERIAALSEGPLRRKHLAQIYERLLDVMRNLQKEDGQADSGSKHGKATGAKE